MSSPWWFSLVGFSLVVLTGGVITGGSHWWFSLVEFSLVEISLVVLTGGSLKFVVKLQLFSTSLLLTTTLIRQNSKSWWIISQLMDNIYVLYRRVVRSLLMYSVPSKLLLYLVDEAADYCLARLSLLGFAYPMRSGDVMASYGNADV